MFVHVKLESGHHNPMIRVVQNAIFIFHAISSAVCEDIRFKAFSYILPNEAQLSFCSFSFTPSPRIIGIHAKKSVHKVCTVPFGKIMNGKSAFPAARRGFIMESDGADMCGLLSRHRNIRMTRCYERVRSIQCRLTSLFVPSNMM